MARPITYDHRKQIIKLRQSGKAYRCIATVVGCSLKSVKRIWYNYQKNGEQALLTNYHKSGRKSPFSSNVRIQIMEIKDGDQGAPYVRSQLFLKNITEDIPHERTIQRWWKKNGIERPKGYPKRKSNWTKEPLHTFQIDGKGNIKMKNEDTLSWLKVADEATGSDLHTRLFPL